MVNNIKLITMKKAEVKKIEKQLLAKSKMKNILGAPTRVVGTVQW